MLAPVEATNEVGAGDVGLVEVSIRLDRVEKELAGRLDAVEQDLAKVKQVQAENVPLFRQTLKRIATMRTTIHSHSNSLMRLEATSLTNSKKLDAQDVVLSEQTKALSEIQVTTANIATWIGGAKGAWGYARKYGPHAISLLVGALVAGGYISAETGKSFSHIFGL